MNYALIKTYRIEEPSRKPRHLKAAVPYYMTVASVSPAVRGHGHTARGVPPYRRCRLPAKAITRYLNACV